MNTYKTHITNPHTRTHARTHVRTHARTHDIITNTKSSSLFKSSWNNM